MNIFTITNNNSSFYVRPDTSLAKDETQYYCLPNIGELKLSRFIFARASKAGKCIAAKFAHRYYSKVGYGVQIIAPELIDSNIPESWLLAHSLDCSTFLSGREKTAEELSQQQREIIDIAFEMVSKYISIRTGDYITIEISSESINSTTEKVSLDDKEITVIW